MSILGRLVQVVRSQVNSWVQESADPEKMLDQAVADMQADLIQLRQSVAQAIATQKRTERQCDQNESLAREWYNRAQLALQKGQETQAREALAQRQNYLQMRSQLARHVDDQRSVIAGLKQNMRDLEVNIADARTRRDMYIARARSAEASQRIQTMMSQVGSARSAGVLDQMEDKVLGLEAEAEALADLNQTLQSQTLEGQFAALEQADVKAAGAETIESELAAMKASLSDPSNPAPNG